MKTKLCLLFVLLYSATTIAQNGINYKAVLKDGNGDILSGYWFFLELNILKTSATGTTVYQESHLPVTDNNGIFMLNIGQGTPISGVFEDIDWGSDAHFLNVVVTTLEGTEDMGTTEFKAVPYALNVTGLEALNEGNGIGWRLKGSDPANYGDIGSDAVDLSLSSVSSTGNGATGISSFASGSNTSASGNYSTAMGFGAVAIGDYSTAMGAGTNTSGIYATAMGVITYASGDYSAAMGYSTDASGSYSTAMGYDTTASSFASTAMGSNTTASGNYSTAMGESTTASGSSSTATGDNTNASGFVSVSMGGYTNASGNFSTAMGYATTASAYASIAIGRFNVGGGNASLWNGSDPIFEIGIGANANSKANALTVLKNGTTTVNSSISTNPDLVLGGISSSSSGDNGIIASDPSYAGSDIFLRSYDAVAIQLDYDNNETGEFEIKAGSGVEIFEITESGNATLAGSLTQNSDRRLKKDISDISYGLNEVLQFKPKSYRWKDRETDKKSLGLIAQEVQPIINEIVNAQDDEAKTLGISYTELIPVLIKAIQEQQDMIQKRDDTIFNLVERVEALESNNKKTMPLNSSK